MIFSMPINIPNLLTLIRIVLIPVIILLHSLEYIYASLFVLGFALLTDFFDGYFARRLKQETEFGAIFDPIADKIVAICFYGYLFLTDLIPVWFAWIILMRNFSQLMSVPILIWWLKKKFYVRPNWFAKWATAISDFFIFIPLYLTIPENFTIPIMVIISLMESYILMNYLPRLFQIATDRHDTFE